MKRILVAAFALFAAVIPAPAQQSAGFSFNAATSLAVTSASSNVALPGTGSKILAQNTGGATAYLAFGNSAVVATTSGMPLLGGECFYVQAAGNYTTIAAITSSSTTTVLLTQGEGNPPISCAPSITGGTGGTSSSFGAAFPAAGTAIGASQGGNMVALNALSGNLLVNCAVGCSGGSSSNASDAVATSSTNGQTLATLYGFNGTTFDRLRVDGSKNLNVNIAANSFGTVTVTGTVAATQSGTWTVQPGNTANTTPWLVTGSGTAGTAAAGVLTVQGIASMTPVQVSQATAANLNATVVGTGTFAVQAAQSGTWTVQPGNTPNTTAWLTQPVAGTAGGSSTTGNIVANNTTGVNLKGSAGVVYGVQMSAIGSTPVYVKLYNKATAPTCGTDTPVKRLIIPAASTAANGSGSNVSLGAVGVTFSLGIGYCVTGGITDADTSSPAANSYLVNVDWL
jgi:hypothetical protein